MWVGFWKAEAKKVPYKHPWRDEKGSYRARKGAVSAVVHQSEASFDPLGAAHRADMSPTACFAGRYGGIVPLDLSERRIPTQAETMRRWVLPACAMALRMKCTRQRCQVALNILVMAAFGQSW